MLLLIDFVIQIKVGGHDSRIMIQILNPIFSYFLNPNPESQNRRFVYSPFKVETFLRVAGIRYTTQTARPGKTARHPPFILEPLRREGAAAIVEYFRWVRGQRRDIDRNLSAEQRAVSRALHALLEVSLVALEAWKTIHLHMVSVLDSSFDKEGTEAKRVETNMVA